MVQVMNCPKCGAKCEKDQSFCVVCGAPIYSNDDEINTNEFDESDVDLSMTRIVSGISNNSDDELHKFVDDDISSVEPVELNPAEFAEKKAARDIKEEPKLTRFNAREQYAYDDEPVYRGNNRQPKKKSKKNVIIIAILAILLVAIIVVSVLFFIRSKNEEKYKKYYNAGVEYYDAKNYAAAATQFNSAANHAVNDSERIAVYEKLWHSYEYMGEYADEEINVLEKLVELNPSEISYYEALIILYQNNGLDNKIDTLINSVEDYSIKEQLSDFDGTIPNPSYEPGEYQKPIEVALHVSNDLNIYYTLDGSEPTKDSKKYTEPIKLETQGNYTIKAISIDENGKSSKQLYAKYKLVFPVVSMPVVSIDSGVYDTQKKITVTADPDCKIYYTKDGSVPDATSTEYTTKIKMPKGNTVFSFIAINADGISSKVVTRVYDYQEVFEYSYDQALGMLTTVLIKNKTMENEYGEFKNGNVSYFSYMSTKKIDKVNYYIISFTIESSTGSVVKEATYAVSCDTGACYTASVSGDSYSIKEIN